METKAQKGGPPLFPTLTSNYGNKKKTCDLGRNRKGKTRLNETRHKNPRLLWSRSHRKLCVKVLTAPTEKEKKATKAKERTEPLKIGSFGSLPNQTNLLDTALEQRKPLFIRG